jgi:hypothetical protein
LQAYLLWLASLASTTIAVAVQSVHLFKKILSVLSLLALHWPLYVFDKIMCSFFFCVNYM